MNRCLGKALGAAVLSLALTVGATGVASAQTNTPSGGYSEHATTRADRNFDWGWLGLIGLAGLAGLLRRPDDHYRRDVGTMGTTSARH